MKMKMVKKKKMMMIKIVIIFIFYARPGTEILDHVGGLHKLENWPGNLLTDSGGFQVCYIQTNNWFELHYIH